VQYFSDIISSLCKFDDDDDDDDDDNNNNNNNIIDSFFYLESFQNSSHP